MFEKIEKIIINIPITSTYMYCSTIWYSWCISMVRFCPRCGGPLIPKGVKDKQLILKCMRCGHEVKTDKQTVNSYRLRFQVEANKRTPTSKAVEAKKISLTPEEREMLREYYEIFLESFQEEGGEE